MSYARWGCDGSDVYVYAHCAGGVVCCGCKLSDEGDAGFKTNAEMIEHLLEHRANGDKVPEYAIERLKEEADNTPEEGL